MNIIFMSDATMLGHLRCCSKELATGLLSDPKIFRLIASLRKLPKNVQTLLASESNSNNQSSISHAERLHIAEVMCGLENQIHFDWASADLRRESYPPLRRFAALLVSHPSITVQIEGHCGIEASSSSVAKGITRARACTVLRALLHFGVFPHHRIKAVGMGYDKAVTLVIYKFIIFLSLILDRGYVHVLTNLSLSLSSLSRLSLSLSLSLSLFFYFIFFLFK